MLRTIKDFKGFSIGAHDGDIGEANDFIFDDIDWTIRYLVADTDRWPTGRKDGSGYTIRATDGEIAHVDRQNANVYVNLLRASIKIGPEFSPDKPDREYETELYNHYGGEN